jgi:HlyD family secretion protein
MRKTRIVIAAIALPLVLAGAWYFGRGDGSGGSAFRFVEVQRGDLQSTVSATGSLSAVTTVQIGTQVSGKVEEIFVDFNDRVRKGQLIARIDPTLARQTVRDAQSTVERNRAEAAQAQSELDRAKQLFDNEALSVSEYETAQYRVQVAQANLSSAQVSLDRARQNLAYTNIYAPIDGIVVERNVDVGQTVAASLSAPQLFLIANDLARMQILASVDESDIGQIEEGQEVQFTVQAYPSEPFEGAVQQVRLQSTSQENVVNYTVVVGVDNQQGKLLPGMTATVDFQVQSAENVLMVPNAALRFRPTPEMLASVGATTSTTATARGESAAARAPNDAAQPAAARNGRAPMGQRGRSNTAMVWYVDDAGALTTARVTTGISDGIVTQIDGPSIREGMQLIAGVMLAGEGGSANPFNQEQPDRRSRGGF